MNYESTIHHVYIHEDAAIMPLEGIVGTDDDIEVENVIYVYNTVKHIWEEQPEDPNPLS